MNDEPTITVPRHLQIFGEAVVPIIAGLEEVVHKTDIPRRSNIELHHLGNAMKDSATSIGQLNAVVCRLMQQVVEQPTISDQNIYWEVGRFSGQLVDPLIAAHTSLTAPRDAEAATPFLLLATVSRNILMQILAWLTNIHDVLTHPEKAYQSNAFQMESGVAMFELKLTLTLPPEMDELRAWVQANGDDADLRIALDDMFELPVGSFDHPESLLRQPQAAREKGMDSLRSAQINKGDVTARRDPSSSLFFTGMVMVFSGILLFPFTFVGFIIASIGFVMAGFYIVRLWWWLMMY